MIRKEYRENEDGSIEEHSKHDFCRDQNDARRREVRECESLEKCINDQQGDITHFHNRSNNFVHEVIKSSIPYPYDLQRAIMDIIKANMSISLSAKYAFMEANVNWRI